MIVKYHQCGIKRDFASGEDVVADARFTLLPEATKLKPEYVCEHQTPGDEGQGPIPEKQEVSCTRTVTARAPWLERVLGPPYHRREGPWWSPVTSRS